MVRICFNAQFRNLTDHWEEAMKPALVLLLSCTAIGGAAAYPSCHDRAAEKNFAGAAPSPAS